MPEGPSIVLAKENLRQLVGLSVYDADGYAANLDFDRLRSTTLKSLRSWGKHLLLKFGNFTLRVHFLMFGSYTIDQEKPGRTAKLAIHFKGGRALFFYAVAIVIVEGPLSATYDWSADVMSNQWDPRKAAKKLRDEHKRLICDVLLDQNIFSGVGNIIKNEVLFRMRVHPLNKVGDIPTKRLKALIADARDYSMLFLKWKRKFELKKHWEAYARKKCPRDGNALKKLYLGETRRRTFFCDICQELWTRKTQ